MTSATLATSTLPSDEQQQWRGELNLTLQQRDGATRLTRRRHHGPQLVQRPFYPEGQDCCHVYLLHPPGGLVGGDSLVGNIELTDQAHALITTPAAGKAYRVATDRSEQGQHYRIRLDAGATLEWFPQETIAFNGARPLIRTRIDVAHSATLIGWDIVCLGRPGANETFTRGQLRQQFELHREGQPLLLEHGQFDGGSAMLAAPWGLHALPVLGTLYCYHAELANPSTGRAQELLASIRCLLAAIEDSDNEKHAQRREPLLAATLVNDVLIVRYLGACTEQCRELFVTIWRTLRPSLLGRPARAPRIWNT